MYSANNPVNFKDDNGKIFDVVVDVGFIVYDVYDITTTVLSGNEVTATQYAALGADLVGAAIPFATGGGAAVRAASKLGKTADKSNDISKTINKTNDISKFKYSKEPPGKLTKLKNNQGWKDKKGNIWKKDMKHKDHWDVSNPKTGKKVKEVDFEGNQIWPDGPKNKNKR